MSALIVAASGPSVFGFRRTGDRFSGAAAGETVPEQGARVPVEHSQRRLEVVAADVDAHSLVGAAATVITATALNQLKKAAT